MKFLTRGQGLRLPWLMCDLRKGRRSASHLSDCGWKEAGEGGSRLLDECTPALLMGEVGVTSAEPQARSFFAREKVWHSSVYFIGLHHRACRWP